jgi:hypothetical protein
MKRFSAWCVFVATSASAATVLGRAPLIDPPTPPPCAADGICYPNTTKWGYYPARWRTWPGTQLEPTPAKGPTEDGRITPELGPAEPPPAEVEDAAAPPTSARPREDGAKTAPGDKPPVAPPGGEPPLPNVPLPDAESASPLGPTSEIDPPPSLPTTLSTTRGRAGLGPAIVAPLNRTVAPQVSTNDPPPAPPWGQSAAL